MSGVDELMFKFVAHRCRRHKYRDIQPELIGALGEEMDCLKRNNRKPTCLIFVTNPLELHDG